MRLLFLLVFLFCTAAMGVALYTEHVLGFAPCPLCIVQRVAMIATGLVALVAALHGARGVGVRLYAGIAALCAAGGAAVAGRHVWLQSLPADQVPEECGMDMGFMVEMLPWQEVASIILSGSGECANVDLQVLGLSIPQWTLIAFVALVLLMLWRVFAPIRPANSRFA